MKQKRFPSETVPFEVRTKPYWIRFNKQDLIDLGSELEDLIFHYFPIHRLDIAANYLILVIEAKLFSGETKTLACHFISYGEYIPRDAICRILKYNTGVAQTLEENLMSANFKFVIHDVVSYLYTSQIIKPTSNTSKLALQAFQTLARKYHSRGIIKNIVFELGTGKAFETDDAILKFVKDYKEDIAEFKARMKLAQDTRYNAHNDKRRLNSEIASRQALERANR